MSGRAETFRIFGLALAVSESKAKAKRLPRDRITLVVEKFNGRVVGHSIEVSDLSESDIDRLNGRP